MELRNYIFLVFLATAVGFFLRNVNRLITYLSYARPDNRIDNLGARMWQTLTVGFAQTKILRDKVAGPLHAGIFWGFLILLASAVEAVLEGLYHGWSLNILGPAYSALTVLTDVFCLLIILGTVFALYRRYGQKVKRLQVEHEKVEAAMILLTIFSIVTSLLLQNSARITLGTDFSWAVRPVGMLVSQMIPVSIAPFVFEVCWWLHILLILGFTNYLPFSKHLHVLTSIPNVFFSKIGPVNSLEPIAFEDETVTRYGVVDIEDLSWKSILDSYTCTHCGRCTSVCPANQTGKVLDPRQIIVAVRDRTMDKAPLIEKLEDYAENRLETAKRDAAQAIIKGKRIDEFDEQERTVFQTVLSESEQATWNKKLIGDYVSQEALYACTTCGACMQECPVNIEHVPVIVGMRRSMVMMEASFNEEAALLPDIYGNMENNAVPWGGFAQEDRANWTEGLEVTTCAEDPEMEVLFWVGCAGSYDDRAKKTTRAFAELMTHAGVSFRILGTEERCTGDPARRTGNEFLADMLTKMNVETMATYNVKTIVTTCPHCFNTLKNDYPQFGGNYEVMHHTQYVKELIDSGRLVVPKDSKSLSKQAIAYHDSCYLGRYNEEYDAPRALLESVPGLQVLEPARSKDRGLCCGAGGGRMFMEEVVGKRVNIERTEELLALKPETIAVNCPFCTTMINDGVKAAESGVQIKDISEILLEQIKG